MSNYTVAGKALESDLVGKSDEFSIGLWAETDEQRVRSVDFKSNVGKFYAERKSNGELVVLSSEGKLFSDTEISAMLLKDFKLHAFSYVYKKCAVFKEGV